jgi:hypothetical protein
VGGRPGLTVLTMAISCDCRSAGRFDFHSTAKALALVTIGHFWFPPFGNVGRSEASMHPTARLREVVATLRIRSSWHGLRSRLGGRSTHCADKSDQDGWCGLDVGLRGVRENGDRVRNPCSSDLRLQSDLSASARPAIAQGLPKMLQIVGSLESSLTCA